MKRSSDFPYPIRFLAGGNFLYFQPRELDLFGPDLQLLKTYPHPSNPKLDFAARSGLVHLSPDQHNISIPGNQESEILATDNLVLRHKIRGQVRALGTNRWFIGWNYSVAEGLTEQIYSDNVIKDLRHIGGEGAPRCPLT